jgi:alginate O-acetyltransferase complex protein AlgI
MTTASFQFLLFALVVAILYNVARPWGWRQAVMLAANVGFLATFSLSLKAFLPFAGFLLLGFVAVRLMQSERRRSAFVLMVITTIIVFIWLKKYAFLPSASFIRFPYVTIGLSYIFFRVLHLIIDARNDNLPHRIAIVGYLNYTLNFTALVSGPIQCYQDFAEMQLGPGRPPLDIFVIGESLERIIVGFFKVSILSLLLLAGQERALNMISQSMSFWGRVAAAMAIAGAYPLYLYFNFSGYTDIVIGVARFLRLTLPENFNRPFSSTNFIDFWGRWHITLSTWLKTYVFNPLTKLLMKKFPSTHAQPWIGVVAFFVTFFLIGAWHGQTPAFLIFGVLLGAGVSVNKLFQVLMSKWLGGKEFKKLSSNPVYCAFTRGLTFTWFTFSLLWFWSNSQQVGSIARTGGAAAFATAWVAIFLSATVLLALYDGVRTWILSFTWGGSPLVQSRYIRTAWNTALATICVTVIVILNAPAPEIVYKAF